MYVYAGQLHAAPCWPKAAVIVASAAAWRRRRLSWLSARRAPGLFAPAPAPRPAAAAMLAMAAAIAAQGSAAATAAAADRRRADGFILALARELLQVASQREALAAREDGRALACSAAAVANVPTPPVLRRWASPAVPVAAWVWRGGG